jgi:hypothetical protein
MESSNGVSQGSDTSAPAGLTSSASAPAPATAAPVSTSDERIFKQSEVNEIVKKAKHGAVEDYRRLSSEQPQYAERKFGTQPQQQEAMQSNQNYLPENEIRRLAAEEAQRLRDNWVKDARAQSEADQANRIVANFQAKIAAGREKYQDFDQVTGDIDLQRFPYVVQLLGEHVENSADMLYELGNDRFKLNQLEGLAERSAGDAIKQAQRMSKSLKDNDAARKIKMPNEPLSQLRPSNTGTDNGVMGVGDYRKKWKV